MLKAMFERPSYIALWVVGLVTIIMWSFLIHAIATAPRESSPPSVEISEEVDDPSMDMPSPGIGMNGKFNPNLLGTVPGL